MIRAVFWAEWAGRAVCALGRAFGAEREIEIGMKIRGGDGQSRPARSVRAVIRLGGVGA